MLKVKGIVTLFGGVNIQSERYFKQAIQIYKQYDYDVVWYDTKNMDCLVPTKYLKNVDKAEERLRTFTKEQLETLPKIIHMFSGGFWTGLELNERINHDAFIMEAAPFPVYNLDNFTISFKKMYGFPIPRFGLEYAINMFGIPTLKYKKEWFDTYEARLLLLKNVVLMNGQKDEYLDTFYIQKFITNFQQHKIAIEYIVFPNANHYNIAKSDIELYKNTIEHYVHICENR